MAFKKLANCTPGNADVSADADSALKLYTHGMGCCDAGEGTTCAYDVTIPTANAVNNIIFKNAATGANQTVTFSPAVTGAEDVVAAIREALTGNCYHDDAKLPADVTSRTSGSNTIYTITTEGAVVSMLHDTSTTVTATAKCTAMNFCTWTVRFAGGPSVLGVKGTSQNMTDITYGPGSGGTATATVQSRVESALTTGSSATSWHSVTVTDVTADSEYEIVVIGSADLALTIDGEAFTRTNCTPGYRV